MEELITKKLRENFPGDLECIMRDPLLFGDYRNAMNEGEPRIYEDLLDYDAIYYLFQEVSPLDELHTHLSEKLVLTFADRGVSRGQRDGFPRPYSRISRPKPLLFLLSSSSVVITRLSGPRSRPSTSQKIWNRRKSNPGFWICSQELWTLDHRGG
jgi:hypothetical protein